MECRGHVISRWQHLTCGALSSLLSSLLQGLTCIFYFGLQGLTLTFCFGLQGHTCFFCFSLQGLPTHQLLLSSFWHFLQTTDSSHLSNSLFLVEGTKFFVRKQKLNRTNVSALPGFTSFYKMTSEMKGSQKQVQIFSNLLSLAPPRTARFQDNSGRVLPGYMVLNDNR